MTPRLRILLTVSALAIFPWSQTMAADYDPPIYIDDAPEYVPVEIGSGWYLRGDVGYNFDKQYKNTELAITNPFTAFAPFSPIDSISFREKDTPISGSIGFGYKFNDFFRADVNVGLLTDDRFSASGRIPDGCAGTQTTEIVTFDPDGEPIEPSTIFSERSARDCGASLSANNSSWTGTLDGYIDLGTISGITPYVGAGVGLLYTKTGLNASALCSADSDVISGGNTTTTTTFLCDGQSSVGDDDVEYIGASYSNRDYNFMYSLMAGFAYQMTTNLSLDVGYRYTSAPDIQYLKIGSNGAEVGEGMDYHQVKLGLRYDLW